MSGFSQQERRAEAPRPPAATPAVRKLRLERFAYLREREGRERRSVWRGLLWLVLAVLCFSLVRAGVDRSFYSGWWRQW